MESLISDFIQFFCAIAIFLHLKILSPISLGNS